MVCSKHFRPEDYRKSLTGMRLLNNNAVPTIFDWSKATNPRSGKATKRTFDALQSKEEHVPTIDPIDPDIPTCSNVPTSLDNVKTPKKTVEQLEQELERTKNLLQKKSNKVSFLSNQLYLCKFGIERFG